MKFKTLLILLCTFLFQGQNFSYPEWADYTWGNSENISWRTGSDSGDISWLKR